MVLSMPIAVAYLAANLRRFGHTVDIIDGIGEAIDQVGQTEILSILPWFISSADLRAEW